MREAADEELRREQAEAIKVVYVAVTRARDLLVVPTCGDQPIEGWLQVLDPMLYPPDGYRRRRNRGALQYNRRARRLNSDTATNSSQVSAPRVCSRGDAPEKLL
jgi:hypothetical protein